MVTRYGWVFVGILTGCIAESNRVLVSIPVLAGSNLEDTSLTLSTGEILQLSTSTITLSNLRMQVPADPVERLVHTGKTQHPGHNNSGDVAGELLGTWVVDLLGDPITLGDASVYTGSFATASLELPGDESTGIPLVITLGGDLVRSDGNTVPFVFEASRSYNVQGIGFEVEVTEDAVPSQLNLTLDMDHMISYVDWTQTDTDGDGKLTLADGDLYNTFMFGVESTPTYQLVSIP